MALLFVVSNNYLFVSCSAEDNKQQDGLTEDDHYDDPHELADPYSESPDEIENYGKANSLTFAKLRLYSE